MKTLKKIRKIASLPIGRLILIIVVLELSSFAVNGIFERQIASREHEALNIRLHQLNWTKSHEYHPFLTYSNTHLKPHLANLPQNNNNNISIGIIGGSVGHDLSAFLETPRGKGLIGEVLGNQNLTKEIKVFDFAIDGSRQPQQLISSILLEKSVDIFVSIEGFNELVNAGDSKCLPIDWNLQTIRFNPDSRSIWRSAHSALKWTYRLWANNHDQLYTSKLLFLAYENHLFKLIQILQRKYWNEAKNNCNNKHTFTDKDVIDYWIDNLNTHHKIFKSMGKPLVTVFHPTLAAIGSKPLSSVERSLFASNPWVAGKVQNRYPVAGERFMKLAKSKGYPLLDLRFVFETETQTVYSDQFGHMNELGNEIFAKRLLIGLKPYLSKVTD